MLLAFARAAIDAHDPAFGSCQIHIALPSNGDGAGVTPGWPGVWPIGVPPPTCAQADVGNATSSSASTDAASSPRTGIPTPTSIYRSLGAYEVSCRARAETSRVDRRRDRFAPGRGDPRRDQLGPPFR